MMIIIQTPLNTMGFSQERENDKKWLKNRIDIMMHFTIPSLINQSDQGFLHLIKCRGPVDYIKECADTYGELPDNIQLVTTDHYKKILLGITDKRFYNVRLNSDDLYHRDFVKSLRECPVKENTQAVIAQNGYYYRMEEGFIEKKTFRSPPFYAIIYNTKEYKEGLRHRPKGGHCGVINLKHVLLPGRQWLYIVHPQCNKLLRGAEFPKIVKKNIIKRDKEKILKEFGIGR